MPATAPPIAPVSMPTVWRSGKLLITTRDVRLNDHCIKCNALVGERRLKRTFYWHHPAIFLTILAGLLIYVIIALIIRKRAVVYVALCPRHRKARRLHIAISWLIVLGAVALGVASVAFDRAELFLLGIAVLLAGLFYAVITVPVLKPKRIDHSWAWFRGCDVDYLAAYPQWPYG